MYSPQSKKNLDATKVLNMSMKKVGDSVQTPGAYEKGLNETTESLEECIQFLDDASTLPLWWTQAKDAAGPDASSGAATSAAPSALSAPSAHPIAIGATGHVTLPGSTVPPVNTSSSSATVNTGVPTGALSANEYFVVGDPRPLGALFPLNRTETQFEYIPYSQGVINFNSKADVMKLNRWKQQKLRRVRKRFGVKVDGRAARFQ